MTPQPPSLPSPLHKLHDGIGVHEELIMIRSLLDGGSMAVDDVGNLREGRREGGREGEGEREEAGEKVREEIGRGR